MSLSSRKTFIVPVLVVLSIATGLLWLVNAPKANAFMVRSLGMTRIEMRRDANSAKHSGQANAPVMACPTASTSIPATPIDLIINQTCTIAGGPGGPGNALHYYYGNINVVSGGTLNFQDAQIDFWAKSIIIENGGAVNAGMTGAPIGTVGRGPLNTMRSVVTINLWGPEQHPRSNGTGVRCQTPLLVPPPNDGIAGQVPSPCGIPLRLWNLGGGGGPKQLSNGVEDWFYKYDTMPDDGADPQAYFGYKVLGLSYGGTLALFGKKGANAQVMAPAGFSGTSWVRLKGNVNAGDPMVTVDGDVSQSWEAGDDIVLTTTDYLPGHSEKLKVKSVAFNTAANTTTVTLDTTQGAAVKYPHNGVVYSLVKPVNVQAALGLDRDSVETRGAVALLSRSIVIQSAGDTITPPNIVAGINEPFPPESSKYYFGGHTVLRQGFQTAEMQGVEFHQMGQGGKLGHYPVHFHMSRKVPTQRTFVADCSVNESMTRWYVIHSTIGLSLLRNVGYLSIGHGYYMEDGTEIDNILYSNIGIFARAGVLNPQNPRQVPGILAENTLNDDDFPYLSDWNHPVVFWITNGWNDFEYNMAAGAGTCGACYWLVPAFNANVSQMMKWTGYSSLQETMENAATTPLKKFFGNTCTTAMNSFMTIGSTAACQGVGSNLSSPLLNPLVPVANPLAPSDHNSAAGQMYYPNVLKSGGRFATKCNKPNGDCSKVTRCNGTVVKNCMVTVLDHFTASFSWADTNLGAVWLRPEWYLFRDSAVTDVLDGGLTFVTGGGFTKSDAIQGYWALSQKSVFIGNTQQPSFSPYSMNDGPFDPPSPLSCDQLDSTNPPGGVCLSVKEGVGIPLANFGVNQRLFNIYDGPSFQDSDAFLDINPTILTGCDPDAPLNPGQRPCYLNWMQGRALGVPRDRSAAKGQQCYLPNAAIAWKQPNGFYYPPAFHSDNLFFNNVNLRHFVIEPEFDDQTYISSKSKIQQNYCTFAFPAYDNMGNLVNAGSFDSYTDIDRQTELNDDDGSLTGLIGPAATTGLEGSISVNLDPYFNAPTQTPECGSQITPSIVTPAVVGTANTSPYDFVTTVIWPSCAQNDTCGQIHTVPPGPNEGKAGIWSQNCGGPFCYGVPLYREFKTQAEDVAMETPPFIRMAGQATFQRSTLTINNGNYYIDTTVPKSQQKSEKYYLPDTATAPRSVNVFQANNTYYVFDVFAKATTSQTFQLYVGTSFNVNTDLKLVRANLDNEPYVMTMKDFPNGKWQQSLNPATGVLTVTMNLMPYASQFNPKKANLCQPHNFCNWQTASGSQKSTCGCTVKPTDILAVNNPGFIADCQTVCQKWAVKALDCPVGGCFGFAVTLPPDFDIDKPLSPDPKPKPTCYPNNPATFDVNYTNVAAPLPGACTYAAALPNPQFCTDPN